MNQFNTRPLISASRNVTFSAAAKELATNLKALGIRSILVGVSGGADSVLTLRLLTEASIMTPLKIGISHVNFNLRGEESLRDEKFVTSLAAAITNLNTDTEIYIDRFDTSSYAKENNLSIEMAARELRHNLWDELISKHHYQRIATGHTADDNEETLLLNLFRGSSPHGLRGMAAVGDRIIRPILYLHKKDVIRLLKEGDAIQRHRSEKFATLNHLYPAGHITDSSNLSSSYRRNFLRNDIIPMLHSRWEGLGKALQSSIILQSEAAAVIEASVNDVLSSLDDPKILTGKIIREFPAPVTLIFHWLHRYGISNEIANDVAGHFLSVHPRRKSGQRWILKDGVELILSNDALHLRSSDSFSYLITEDVIPDFKDWKKIILDKDICNLIRKASVQEIYIPDSPNNYAWRHPKKGDRIRIATKATKLVSDILKEAGIPYGIRSSLMLLASKENDEPIWIPGVRRSASHLINLTESNAESHQKSIWHLTI